MLLSSCCVVSRQQMRNKIVGVVMERAVLVHSKAQLSTLSLRPSLLQSLSTMNSCLNVTSSGNFQAQRCNFTNSSIMKAPEDNDSKLTDDSSIKNLDEESAERKDDTTLGIGNAVDNQEIADGKETIDEALDELETTMDFFEKLNNSLFEGTEAFQEMRTERTRELIAMWDIYGEMCKGSLPPYWKKRTT